MARLLPARWWDRLTGGKRVRALETQLTQLQAALDATTQKRAFAGARVGRLTESWKTSDASINQQLRGDLALLRKRARSLVHDTSTGRRYMGLVATHIVGPHGFTLQCRARMAGGKALDKAANDAVETAWEAWAQMGVCDVSGKLSFVDVCRLVAQAAARDGEFLVRRVRGRSVNAFGFALQVLDVDRIDTTLNAALDNGNTIRMGVEISSAGRPVAYWLFNKHPGDDFQNGRKRERERVPASEILHGFVPLHAEQVRGVTWFHAVVTDLHHQAGFQEAAVVAARIGAAKGGFFTEEADGGEVQGGALADGVDAHGELSMSAEPGTFQKLPPGVGFQAFDPDYPHAFYGTFMQALQRSTAAGLDIDYATLTGDLSQVNYSSARIGLLETRDFWKAQQEWLIGAFLRPVFLEWLSLALLNGQIRLESGAALPAERVAKFGPAAKFVGRRWAWVDPEKEVNADVTAIKNRLKSRTEVAAERGRDLEDVARELEAEEDLLDELGLDAEQAPPAAHAAPASPAPAGT